MTLLLFIGVRQCLESDVTVALIAKNLIANLACLKNEKTYNGIDDCAISNERKMLPELYGNATPVLISIVLEQRPNRQTKAATSHYVKNASSFRSVQRKCY